ncbi:uncharacterized protein LOC121920565 [Sceloporus undulatus]|uniref:uncharacterized protein LOC121920565 n=1 Tax=Sceloporus undulatus TaxID=8520 RepID=UPI001C4B82B1|nr:uncharacterized protein LOC121920565 [Sceloporus undulatus]
MDSFSSLPPYYQLFGNSTPKGWRVSSLETMCLAIVAENMKPVWVNYMADVHIQELIQSMNMSNRLTPAMLHAFLVPNLTVLNLNICQQLVDKTIVQTIRVQCKNLSTLNLHGCIQIPVEALVDLIKGLRCLTKLDLSETECDTEVLLAVGSSCQKLRELNISNCRRLSPYSLFYLAYDDDTCSFCCPELERLSVTGLTSRVKHQDLIWSLVFVLLVLPKLKVLTHELLEETLHLIHSKKFDRTQMPCEYSSLIQLAWCRTFTHTKKGRITLPLQEVHDVCASSLPVIFAMCPQLTKLTVIPPDGQSMSQSSLSYCSLTHLTINCREMNQTKLRELLPVTAVLGVRLQSLSISNVIFWDELSFPTLLSHCANLHKFSASFSTLPGPGHSRQLTVQEADCTDFSLAPLKFPWLSDFSLEYIHTRYPLPSQHQKILRECLLSLLKHSQVLEVLNLVHLPFRICEVFEKVLDPPGSALLRLCELSVVGYKVPVHTIRQLLSSENQLSHLHISCCSRFGRKVYNETFWRD